MWFHSVCTCFYRGRRYSNGNNKLGDLMKNMSTVKPVKNAPKTDMKNVKTTGIKIRGTGAATKGTMARGPMA